MDREEYYLKYKIMGQKGRGLGHVTCFSILWFPQYLWNS